MRINLLVLFILFLGIISCTEEELDELTYPRKFVYSGIEYTTERNYRITENGYESIDAPPIRDSIRTIVIEGSTLDPELGISSMEITILSDSEMELYALSLRDTIDLSLNYEWMDNQIIVRDERFIDTLTVGNESFIPLTTNDNLTQMRIAFDAYNSRSYSSFHRERRWKPVRLYTGFFDSEKKYTFSDLQLLEYIKDESSLAVSDTILLWRGDFIYEME